MVNKLADECSERLTHRDPARPITGDLVLAAKEYLIQARTTHLDALAERLKTPEVKKVVQAILVGEVDPTLAQGRDLLQEFQTFWREHSEVWEIKADYTEAIPHLLLLAFLQRLFNGSGRITREYAAGRGRMDLLVEYAGQSFIIEITLVKASKGWERTLEEGLNQVSRYRAKLGEAAR